MQNTAQFQPVAWWWTRNQIGRDLRDRYEVPQELPPKLQTLVMKVDSLEGLTYSGIRREEVIDARRIGGIRAFPDWFVLT